MADNPSDFSLSFRMDDPEAANKAAAFVRKVYEANRAQQVEKWNRRDVPAAQEPAEGGIHGTLDADNLPSKDLNREDFAYLITLHTVLDTVLKLPLAETDDPALMAKNISEWTLLNLMRQMISRLLNFVIKDHSLHPERAQRFDAVMCFDYGVHNETFPNDLRTTSKYAFLGCLLAHGQPGSQLFAATLNVFQNVADIYYTAIAALFKVDTTDCRRAAAAFVRVFGTVLAMEKAMAFVRETHRLFLAIQERRRTGAVLTGDACAKALAEQTEEIQHLTKAVTRNTAVVERVDRRQSNLIDWIKKKFIAFIGLFPPRSSAPFREEVRAAILPPDRYARIANFPEPRKTQLLEAIQHTEKHPIDFETRKKGAYTLDNAAADVWNARHEIWEKSGRKGGYETLKAYQSGCQGLRKPAETDPFCYRK